jgi:hypothetical protein
MRDHFTRVLRGHIGIARAPLKAEGCLPARGST